MRKIRTSLLRCDPMQDEKACGLLQMEYTVPPEVLYSAYWYRSGTNQTMRNHLSEIAREAAQVCGKPDALVLDIGCNDGTLLNSYPPTFRRIGVDPSDVAQEIEDEIEVIRDLFPSVDLLERLSGRKFDIVTAIAMFYDLEDPIAFTRGVREVLADDGLWVFEMSYMPLMIERNAYDTICHEHLEYYSLAVVEYVLRHAGMKVVNAVCNDINGGSIRCMATHTGNFRFRSDSYYQNIRHLRQREFDAGLDTDLPYRQFQERVNIHREDLNRVLRELKSAGKRIHLYGASTKGNTILQWCGIDSRIVDAAAERNPDKYGARTLGTEIPIISEEESRVMKPDYYLVLPWHFRDEFLEREREMLEGGTAMIFPLPRVEIVRR